MQSKEIRFMHRQLPRVFSRACRKKEKERVGGLLHA